jgi:hypothetical protein
LSKQEWAANRLVGTRSHWWQLWKPHPAFIDTSYESYWIYVYAMRKLIRPHFRPLSTFTNPVGDL